MTRPLNADGLAAIAACHVELASAWLAPLQATMDEHAIDTRERVAAFLAQVCHESNGLSELEEDLRYSAARLAEVWPKHFALGGDPSSGRLDARQFGGQPERIANVVYGGRMGNGDAASGDGWRFRGRGLIQLTGRTAYRECGTALDIDLVSQPGRLIEKSYAAASAGWFWRSIDGNRWADVATEAAFRELTRAINGDLTGWEQRLDRWSRARALLREAA